MSELPTRCPPPPPPPRPFPPSLKKKTTLLVGEESPPPSAADSSPRSTTALPPPFPGRPSLEPGMRINGRNGGGELEGHPSPTSSQLAVADDMIENENESLRERVSDLERKLLDQGDELVCLRSTLADALRRISSLEANRAPAPTTPTSNAPDVRNGARSGGSSPHISNHVSPSTPSKDAYGSSGVRLRHPPPTSDNRETLRRVSSYAPSSMAQRRAVRYQSTGSLHSADSQQSSASASPAPSPSPTHTPAARASPSLRQQGYHHQRLQPSSPSNHSQHGLPPASSSSSSNLHISKRWSSTGDFQNMSPAHYNNSNSGGAYGQQQHHLQHHFPHANISLATRLATKSLFNLYMRPQQHSQSLKHGTRDATYNEEEGYVRMFLRGRPVILYAPSNLEGYDITKVATAPSSKLKLEWVYGYRGRDCRSNLYLLPTGEVVYFVAAAVVLHNLEEQAQRHYLGHTDDVKCIAIHPNKLLIASGQTAGHDRREGRPHVRIWNSVSLSTLHVIGLGEFERSICCLSFSKADGGTLLCAVDEAPDHNISIWDWQKGERGQKIAETKCSVDTVVSAEFHPMERTSIVTCGKSHIAFWNLEGGCALSKRMGIFENRDKPKYVTCLAFSQTGDVISGDSNGNIIVWGRGTNTVAKYVRGVHEGSIFSITVMKEGNVITGGGKDGKLIELDSQYSKTGLEAQLPEFIGGVRTVTEGRGGQIIVGTTKNCIAGGSLDLGLRTFTVGHTDELWALAVHPSLPQFLTGGYDKLIHLWDSQAHDVVWSKELEDKVQSATFSIDGGVIVLGTVTGRWMCLDAETKEIFSEHTDGDEPIQVMKFSPDGSLLALGSRDNNLYIYEVTDESRKYSRVGRCSGHSSYVTHLDWSTDSQYIQTNSGDYEVLYWNASLCRQIPQSSQLRDVEWATHTCTLSFGTIGVWPEGADGTDINNCDRSHDGSLMATADDFGKVKLYSYPVCQPKSLCHTYGGHSSHVTNVNFLVDDTRLISSGGADTSIMQWMLC
ncbi:echinoderm microtubule-associated protein-like 2 isoform X2 [Ischnura elegans]|uniref:echinoderm microtubule-associated protein-like 2 isoform X2 n=1 Tax=Ischnura elegans TaxID=197161 RepID=UPI001ED8AE96|nr:echinoderm microtubule-associated protein-like 2 isoform X2 [Ischnura elegans]